MKTFASGFFSFFVLIQSFQIFAHGEDVPGPHGGHIQMPGGFHTELVLMGNAIRVYLLDMDFRNPQTTDSAVSAEYQDEKLNVTKMECKVKGEGFECPLPKNFSAKKGRINLKPKKAEMYGMLTKYQLPLPAFQAKKAKPKAKMPHAH